MARITIIDTGVANIRSLQAAFERLGHDWKLTTSSDDIQNAEQAVLPGVGTFSAAMDRLRELKLVDSIRERIDKNRPTLAVCLGLQLLCESSDEAPGETGLGLIPASIQRFPDEVQVPQLGWNEVTPQGAGPFSAGQAYFANSFRLTEPPENWGYAMTDYAGPFVSSLWKGRVLACQFHPELSGSWGQNLLKNWIEGHPYEANSGVVDA